MGQQPLAEGEQAGSRPRPTDPRRLTRRTDQKILGGVASGLATYFDIDPLIFRLGFVALGLLTFPLGVLVYLIAWAVVPADTDRGRRPEDGARLIWVILAVLAAAVVIIPLLAVPWWSISFNGPFPWYGPLGFDIGFRPGIFWALVLIGLGFLLFQRSERAEPPSPASSTTLPAPVSTGSTLGRLAVAAGLVVAGLAALLDNLGVFDLSTRRLLALLLLVVGAALLVGAWWGTAWWLIVIGILLVPALLSASVVETFGFPAGGLFGDHTWRPASQTEVATPLKLGVGDLLLDLTQLPLSTEATRVAARVGIGDVEAIVPVDADVAVRSRIGVGELDLFGRRLGGMGLEVTDHASGQAGAGRLVLDIESGLGDVTVRRAPATASTEER